MAILAFQESLVGLCCALIYTAVEDLVLKPQDKMYDMVVEFCEATILSFYSIGFETYSVLKAAHPVLVGDLLNLTELRYYNNLKTQTLADLPACPLKDYLTIPSTEESHCKNRTKLAGLSKAFTYPVICVNSSVANVVSKSLVFNADDTAARKALCMFRKIFIKNYVRKHRAWPPTEFTGPVPGPLADARSKGVWSEPKDKEWPSIWFENVEIHECLEFDWQVDPI